MISIEVLSPDDWKLWRELRREALTTSAAAFGSTIAEWTGIGDCESRWRTRLSDVDFNIVLRLSGTPAGMVSAHVQVDGVVELTSMWVAPFARGCGVGDSAVGAVTGWAHPRDIVLSVKTDNHPAIALYKRHGFADAGPSPEEPDEMLMLRPHDTAGPIRRM